MSAIIHYIGASKSSQNSLVRNYKVETPIVAYGHVDYYSIKRVEDLFRTGGPYTASTGQPVGQIGTGDPEFSHLKPIDVSVSHVTGSSSGNWFFNVSLTYGLKSELASFEQAPWDESPKWSSVKGSAERFKFVDADGKPLIMSNGQPFVSPVAIDRVIIYTVTWATTAKPWSDQENFLDSVNNASFLLTEPNINAPAETLWCVDYQVSQAEYTNAGGTTTDYYNRSVSIAYINGDTWVDLITDMINYENVLNDAGTAYIKKELIDPRTKAPINGPLPGNGNGELLDYNADNVASNPVTVPVPVVISSKSVQRQGAILEYWFKKRKSFTGIV